MDQSRHGSARATSAGFALTALAAWTLSSCAPTEYRPPSLKDAHALVTVRLAYHAWSGTELEQLVTIDGNDIRDFPPPAPREGAVATRTIPVQPGHRNWMIQTTFFHNNVSTHAETYETTEFAPCGASDCPQIRPHTRLVNKVDRVDDASCSQGLKLTASAGETYLLEYDYTANQQCSLRCYRQVHARGGATTNAPCSEPAASATKP